MEKWLHLFFVYAEVFIKRSLMFCKLNSAMHMTGVQNYYKIFRNRLFNLNTIIFVHIKDLYEYHSFAEILINNVINLQSDDKLFKK